MRAAFALAALLAFGTTLADECGATKPLYVPVETARTALGLPGESRTAYFDRRYGQGAWYEERQNAIRIDAQTHGAPIAIHVAPIPESGGRIELIVESRVAYIGKDNRPTTVTGHRSIGGYELAAGEAGNLTVPRHVFRESGALIVVLATPGMRGARRYAVAALDVAIADCPKRIYVEDRFTAIRLNQSRAP